MARLVSLILLLMGITASAYPNPSLDMESIMAATRFRDSLMNIRLRKHLCPPSHSSSSYRYHNGTGSCFKIGDKGPCGDNMVFHSEMGSKIYGECDCDFLNSNIPLVYHPKEDKCYHVYTQAYCQPGSWLVFSPSPLEPSCQPDKCSETFLFDPEMEANTIVEFKGRCVPINTRSSLCNPDEIIMFGENQVLPNCGKREDSADFSVTFRSVFKTRTLSCRPGSRLDRHGRCRRVVTTRSSTTTTTTPVPTTTPGITTSGPLTSMEIFF